VGDVRFAGRGGGDVGEILPPPRGCGHSWLCFLLAEVSLSPSRVVCCLSIDLHLLGFGGGLREVSYGCM
jgi:hypothetical protein